MRRTANERRRGFEALEDRLVLTALPPGFSETLVTNQSDLSGPTAMEFSPTGQLWVLEQSGNVKLVRPDGSTHTAIDLNVDSTGERGLLGIAFAPNYDGAGPNTDFVYLYYTQPNPGAKPNNRISRFTVTGAGTTTPTLGSELVLRNLPVNAEDNDSNHNGGAIHFGPDGKLYVAVGDHHYTGVSQADHVSQKLDTPFGKILRLNPDGSNPSDNPFTTGSSTDWAGAIWALGLRNPYTFAFEPGTGKMFVNDVGEGTWEEINLGGKGFNYGWAGTSSPVWEGFEASPKPPWANYHDPLMAYDHNGMTQPSPAAAAITGGVFYPANSQFGNAFAGKYFYADFGGNFIRVYDPAHTGTPTQPDISVPFGTDTTTSGPVDLKVDSAGNLYYLARGGTGEIYRISFTQVVGRQLFYNNSSYDGNNPAANSADDAAIAADKSAYLPGTGPATFANVSSFTQGINGVMIDISGPHGTISADDFIFRVGNNNSPNSWATATAPSSVVTRSGAGVGGSDRIEITWADDSIRRTWLEVIVRANSDTKLGQKSGYPTGQADVFFFGSALADSGLGDTSTQAIVDPTDEIGARNNPARLFDHIPTSNIYDYNRDGKVDPTDQILARNNPTGPSNVTLFLNIGSPPAAPEAEAAVASGADSDGGVASALVINGSASAAASGALAARAEEPRHFSTLAARLSGGVYADLALAELARLYARANADGEVELDSGQGVGVLDEVLAKLDLS